VSVAESGDGRRQVPGPKTINMDNWGTKKKKTRGSLTFHEIPIVEWGILIMVYYNPQITG